MGADPGAGGRSEGGGGVRVGRDTAPGVLFLWWQEGDGSVVAQVVDFERGVVHTTWTSPGQGVAAFQGTVAPDPA